MAASKGKVAAIVKHLDADGNGYMDPSEVKVLIAAMTGTPIEKIPDDHYEVQELSDCSADELIEQLHRFTDKDIIDEYFAVLGLGGDIEVIKSVFRQHSSDGSTLQDDELRSAMEHVASMYRVNLDIVKVMTAAEQQLEEPPTEEVFFEILEYRT